jgi:hypothetical protein
MSQAADDGRPVDAGLGDRGGEWWSSGRDADSPRKRVRGLRDRVR